MTIVAIIDTGTNSTRMLIARRAGSELEELARLTTVTRLGEGVDAAGRLGEAARERVSRCVGEYAEFIAAHSVENTLMLATSSVRESSDGEQFLAQLARQHGFSCRILPGKEEARLSFVGATLGLGGNSGRIMLVDIGGGSTEIACGVRGRVDYARSLRLGCVRISERFFREDPPAAAELAGAARQIDATLAAGIELERLGAVDLAVAVAGTVTSLAAIDLELQLYDRDAVHGHVLDRQAVDGMLERLARMDFSQRLAIATVEEGRADVIVGGALIASRVMEYIGVASLTVSETDIMDAAALELCTRLDGRLSGGAPDR